MLKLYFENSRCEMIHLGDFGTIEQCNEKIKEDINVRSKGRFIPPYYIYNYDGKTVEESSNIVIDVGSHTEFYHIKRG